MVKAKKTKKLKKTLPLKVQAYIQDTYYKNNKDKPFVKLG